MKAILKPAVFALVAFFVAVKTQGALGFINLHNFDGEDGANPLSSLTLVGNALYGTTSTGGINFNGAIFKININGIDFTNLYSFSASDADYGTNTDGANPFATLLLSGTMLYGTTMHGGNVNDGTIFAVGEDGTGFTNLHNFNRDIDGYYPEAGLLLLGQTLYGTATFGTPYHPGAPNYDVGSIISINTNGSDFTNLFSFSQFDGSFPCSDLVSSNDCLYGVTSYGGINNAGTVFKINVDGTGFTNLYNFNGADGARPFGKLVLCDNKLFGVTPAGGTYAAGTVFAINTDGANFTNLHNFEEFIAIHIDIGT